MYNNLFIPRPEVTMRSWSFVSLLVLALSVHIGVSAATGGAAVRIKDIGRLQGWRDNALVGYGLVTGLAGTGDSAGNKATRQALSNMMAQFDQAVSVDQVQSRNVAVVMVTASLPALARVGDTLDVTVSSSGDAKSLVGGALLMAPLRGADGRVYVLAQGPLTVGGYRYDANGNAVQKNHPTVASVPGGGTVEVGMPRQPGAQSQVTFVLSNPDYTTASRVATAINDAMGEPIAEARDASGIEIQIPDSDRASPVAFFARIENVWVDPDRRAKVVINERTGTVVAGGDVRIQPVIVSQGDLRVSVATENSVSQPGGVIGFLPGIHTAMVANSQVDVSEGNASGFVMGGSTVADLVQALAKLRTNTRDIISVLRAVKAAGALHAELIVQ